MNPQSTLLQQPRHTPGNLRCAHKAATTCPASTISERTRFNAFETSSTLKSAPRRAPFRCNTRCNSCDNACLTIMCLDRRVVCAESLGHDPSCSATVKTTLQQTVAFNNSHCSRRTTFGFGFQDESGTQAQGCNCYENVLSAISLLRQVTQSAPESIRPNWSRVCSCGHANNFCQYVPPHHISALPSCYRYTVCHLFLLSFPASYRSAILLDMAILPAIEKRHAIVVRIFVGLALAVLATSTHGWPTKYHSIPRDVTFAGLQPSFDITTEMSLQHAQQTTAPATLDFAFVTVHLFHQRLLSVQAQEWSVQLVRLMFLTDGHHDHMTRHALASEWLWWQLRALSRHHSVWTTNRKKKNKQDDRMLICSLSTRLTRYWEFGGNKWKRNMQSETWKNLTATSSSLKWKVLIKCQ